MGYRTSRIETVNKKDCRCVSLSPPLAVLGPELSLIPGIGIEWEESIK